MRPIYRLSVWFEDHILGIIIALILGITVAAAWVAWGEEATAPKSYPTKGQCPKTGIVGDVSDCLRCHTQPSFALKDPPIDEGKDYPYGVVVRPCKGDHAGEKIAGHYTVMSIIPDQVFAFFDYLDAKSIRHAVIEIHSPGGSLFDAQRIVSRIQEWQASGGIVETRVYGWAASAGFYIFMSGDKRMIGPQAQLMWHELLTFAFFTVSTPSQTQDEADTLKHLQHTMNEWVAQRAGLTEDKIKEMIHKKEWWFNGAQAKEMNFATGLLQ
jgi:ATP-dependent protease ClpP protease subunit